jgi:photosystem II stability/assembly factor-like uncharacterized protein
MSLQIRSAFIRSGLAGALLLALPALISASSSGSTYTWTNKGPEGGTVTCIAFDPFSPGTLYAGTPGGGVFKSTDKGETWTRAGIGLTEFYILALAVDPTNSSTLYCATENAGMFKSTDGGETWTAMNSGLSELAVVTLVIDPVTPQTVYAGTFGAGVFKTTNGGRNWIAVNTGLGSRRDHIVVLQLAIDPETPATVYAAAGYDGIFKTVNGGRTWTALSTFPGTSTFPGSADALIMDPHDGKVLYAAIGYPSPQIWKTVDGGATWNPVGGIGLSKFTVLSCLILDPNNSRTLIATGFLKLPGTVRGIFRTRDGGETWTALKVPDDVTAVEIDPHDSSTMWAGSDIAGLYRSTDGGNSWTRSVRGISAVAVHGLAVEAGNSRTVYASTFDGLFKSTDGGNTWDLKLSDPVKRPAVIDPANPAIVYAASVNDHIFKSNDGGGRWRRLDGVRAVTAVAIDPNNSGTLYAGASDFPGPPPAYLGIYKSEDGGETWRPANTGLPTYGINIELIAVDPKDSANVYAAIGGGLYRSTDGGGSWHLLTSEFTATSLALDTDNPGILYAAATPRGLFKTVDGGATWSLLDNVLKRESVDALAMDGTGGLYAATNDGGVFRSTDGGESWAELNRGVTMPPIYTLAVDPRNAETVYAGNSGGVFKLERLNSEWKLNVPSGGAASRWTGETSASVQSGYAAASVESGQAPYGVAVFSFRQNGVLVSEAGVPVSPPTRSARIFVEYRSGVPVHGQSGAGLVDVDTGLALVNRGSLDAGVLYTLRSAEGEVVAAGRGMLRARTHFAKFVHQLTSEAPDFKLPEDFSTAVQFGSLDITSSQPVSVLALRITVNQRNEALLTTTPTVDLAEPLSRTRLYFPHFVDGGGYSSKLILVNTSGLAETGVFSLYADGGEPLTFREAGGLAGSSFSYTIQPGGVFVFQSDGSPATFRQGSVLVTPSGASMTPAGAGVFSFSQHGILVGESGIPSSKPATHARIYVDQSGGHGTGLAIAVPGSGPATINLRAYHTDGTTPAGNSWGPIMLRRNGHTAAFVPDLISGLPDGFTGLLDVASASPFVALTLRSLTNSRDDILLTTFPVADANRAAPSPLVFPQIADGGGHVTQFILLGAGGASSLTLNLHDQGGSPLTVGGN